MDASALLLSRIQFGFTISFHIIFPAFTIGLGAWLARRREQAQVEQIEKAAKAAPPQPVKQEGT